MRAGILFLQKDIIIIISSYGFFQISLKQQPAAAAERSLQTSRHPHWFVSEPSLKFKQYLDNPQALELWPYNLSLQNTGLLRFPEGFSWLPHSLAELSGSSVWFCFRVKPYCCTKTLLSVLVLPVRFGKCMFEIWTYFLSSLSVAQRPAWELFPLRL